MNKRLVMLTILFLTSATKAQTLTSEGSTYSFIEKSDVYGTIEIYVNRKGASIGDGGIITSAIIYPSIDVYDCTSVSFAGIQQDSYIFTIRRWKPDESSYSFKRNYDEIKKQLQGNDDKALINIARRVCSESFVEGDGKVFYPIYIPRTEANKGIRLGFMPVGLILKAFTQSNSYLTMDVIKQF